MERSSKSSDAESGFQAKPIGFIRTGMVNKFDAPHQPDHADDQRSVIELLPNQDFHKAVEDLDGFEYIWVVSWFHRNSSWKPKVTPPRGEEVKRGLFATRSPHRPNPIGLTAVKLISISGREIVVGSCDLVDGTPILDIKPYIPAVDSFPDAKIGWLQDVEQSFSQPPQFQVQTSEKASEQLQWLDERNVRFIERAKRLLERDPSENRTRRIKRHGENLFRMGCAEWRIFFTRHEDIVQIEFIRPGYKLEQLQSPGFEVIPNYQHQIDFLATWPNDAW